MCTPAAEVRPAAEPKGEHAPAPAVQQAAAAAVLRALAFLERHAAASVLRGEGGGGGHGEPDADCGGVGGLRESAVRRLEMMCAPAAPTVGSGEWPSGPAFRRTRTHAPGRARAGALPATDAILAREPLGPVS
jgi:hypothetical protein